MTVDNLLWWYSRGSKPHAIPAPCMTVAEAIRRGLVPPGAIVLGDVQACICLNTQSGHPVVCLKVDPCPPGRIPPDCHESKRGEEPPRCYDLKGNPCDGQHLEAWTGQDISDELAAGLTGAILDCYDLATYEQQVDLLNIMHASDKQELYDAVKALACLLLDYINQTGCEPEDPAIVDALDMARVLADFCPHWLLDDALTKWDQCPKPIPPFVPAPPIIEVSTGGPPAQPPGGLYLCITDTNPNRTGPAYRLIYQPPGALYMPTPWETVTLLLGGPELGCPPARGVMT